MIEFHRQCFDAHQKYAEELGFSPVDWWSKYSTEDTKPVTDEQLEQLNFYGYYRCYPMRDQDVAIVGTNPRFVPSGPGHPVFEFSEMEKDFNSIMQKSVLTMKSYFTDYSEHPRDVWLGVTQNDEPLSKGVFRPLATETNILNKEKYLEESFYDDEFYDSVYYTNLFKFGSSPTFDELPDPDRAVDLGAQFLKEELKHVDPNVLIMLGRTFPMLTDSAGVTTVHGTHQSYEGYDVVPHIHPSGYRQNKSEGDYERYKDTIKKLFQ